MIEALDTQVSDLLHENAELKRRKAELQAREIELESEIAAVCPEDRSLAETIGAYRARLNTLENALEAIVLMEYDTNSFLGTRMASKAARALAAKDPKA